MRILLFTESACADIGRHVIDLAGGLLAEGHEVHVLYSPTRMDAEFEAGLWNLTGLRSVAVRMAPAAHRTDVVALRRIAQTLRDKGPFDVVHAHGTKAGLLLRLLGRPEGARLVYTPHGVATQNPDLSGAARALLRSVELGAAGQADALVASTPDERAELVSCGVDAARVHLVPVGVDGAPLRRRAAARAELGLEPNDVAVGLFGDLVPARNPIQALQAFALVAHQVPRALLIVAGVGPLEGELRAETARLGLQARVRFLPEAQLARSVSGLDVYFQASRHEDRPYAALQALAAGVPLAATALGSALLAVVPGVTGELVEVDSPEDLATALDALLVDARRRARMGRCARARAARFSLDSMLEGHLGIYRRLRAQHRRAMRRARAWNPNFVRLSRTVDSMF